MTGQEWHVKCSECAPGPLGRCGRRRQGSHPGRWCSSAAGRQAGQPGRCSCWPALAALGRPGLSALATLATSQTPGAPACAGRLFGFAHTIYSALSAHTHCLSHTHRFAALTMHTKFQLTSSLLVSCIVALILVPNRLTLYALAIGLKHCAATL